MCGHVWRNGTSNGTPIEIAESTCEQQTEYARSADILESLDINDDHEVKRRIRLALVEASVALVEAYRTSKERASTFKKRRQHYEQSEQASEIAVENGCGSQPFGTFTKLPPAPSMRCAGSQPNNGDVRRDAPQQYVQTYAAVPI